MSNNYISTAIQSIERWTDYHLTFAAVLLAMVPPLFFTTGGYISRIFILIIVFSIFTIALNIVFGHTDQLFLFVGAIAGISSYSTALLADAFGVSMWLTVFPSALFAASIGALVSYIAARRKATIIVIAIITLALQLAVTEVLIGARDITRGSTGFVFNGLRIPFVEETLNAHPDIILYYMLSILLIGVLYFYQRLMNSKYGIAFDMIRQDETGAETAGVNVVKYKTVAGFASTFIIGLTAPFYVQLEGYILPGLFTFSSVDVLVLIMLILGGLRTMYGPVFGAATVVFVNEQLAQLGPWKTVIFGLMLMTLFLSFRQGIAPYLKELVTSRFDRSKSSTQNPAD